MPVIRTTGAQEVTLSVADQSYAAGSMETERARRLSILKEYGMATKENRLILVTGATGHQGGAAIYHLRQKNFPIRAVTRDPGQPKTRSLVNQGVEIVRADLEDSESLPKALDGVYGVYSVQSHAAGTDSEVRQGINLADAAKRSRVSHFVYSSVASADKNTGVPHFDSKFRIEEHIRATGLPFSIIRPVFFMENWLGMKSGIDRGTLALPLRPETRLQMIAVDDIGTFIALAFEHSGKWNGRAMDIAGAELSMTELAQVFTRVSGRGVHYRQVPWDEFEKQLGPEMAKMYKWFEDGGYHVDISSVEREYPRLTSFERWIKTNWHVAAAAGR